MILVLLGREIWKYMKYLFNILLVLGAPVWLSAQSMGNQLRSLESQIQKLDAAAYTAIEEDDASLAFAYYEKLKTQEELLKKIPDALQSMEDRLKEMMTEARQQASEPEVDARRKQYFTMQFRKLKSQLQELTSEITFAHRLHEDVAARIQTLESFPLLQEQIEQQRILRKVDDQLRAVQSFQLPGE
jgi:uncharacterized protein (DUF342 family)